MTKYATYKYTPGAGQSLAFTAGRGYYSKKGKGSTAPTPPADPLAQTPEADIWARINRIASGLGAPQTNAQIQTSAQGMIDPVITQMTGNINTKAKQASDAIAGNASSLASELGKIDYTSPYDAAESQQAAVDAALRQAQAGGGAALADDLQKRLGVIGDPAVAAAANNVAQTGSAAGATELARGSANLGALVADRAGAAAYGKKQPGLAKLAGLQDISGVQQGAVNDIADQTGQVLQQLPNLVQSLRSNDQNLRGNKAQLVSSLYDSAEGRNVTKATAAAGFGIDTQKIALTAAQQAAQLKVQEQKLQLEAVNANLKAAGLKLQSQKAGSAVAAAIAKGNDPNAALSAKYGHIVNAHGDPILDADGKQIPVVKTTAVPIWSK